MKSFSEFFSEQSEVPKPDLREAFVQGDLVKEADRVFVKALSEWCDVEKVGPNYVIVKSTKGKSRHWLGDVDWEQGVK